MKRYKHNLSYYNLATMDMGRLVPIGLTEALPGDTFQHHTNVVIRVSPMAAPIMHSITARVHHFFVPHRLVWDNWEDFITGGPDGNNTDTVPTITLTQSQWDDNRLPDYFGVPRPTTGIDDVTVSALPFRAFNLIYNEYYRDQDLITERTNEALGVPFIAWEKDYFTTCRPWTQKGPDVTLPVGTQAEVFNNNPNANPTSVSTDANGRAYYGPSTAPESQLFADLTTAEAINVNDFRKAFALQRYQEARARYGSRYVEYLRYLGVRPRDERLQRPEFLGGGSSQVQVSEVLQTAPETAQQPSTEFGVGDMYGHGIAAMRSNKYRRTMEEHGYVITLMSVRPKAIYTNGLDRTWIRRDKEDFFQKELQHIGQQEVYNQELYQGDDPTGIFGYQDRYAEYRQNFSRVTGEFRDILNYWHMGREFTGQPVLNQSFIDCDATKRIHNEQTQHALWCMVQHKIGARRLVDRSAMPRIY